MTNRENQYEYRQVGIMHFGIHDNFFWFEHKDLTLAKLLNICPQILEGRYVVVTAFDSGPLRLMDEERTLGWIEDGFLTYSPRIEKASSVPKGEYDEWYTFLTEIRIDPPDVFVNDSGFTLTNPEEKLVNMNPTWDRAMQIEWAEITLEKQFRFWRQLQKINPESYLAEGDRLVFVTSNAEHHETIQRYFQKRT